MQSQLLNFGDYREIISLIKFWKNWTQSLWEHNWDVCSVGIGGILTWAPSSGRFGVCVGAGSWVSPSRLTRYRGELRWLTWLVTLLQWLGHMRHIFRHIPHPQLCLNSLLTIKTRPKHILVPCVMITSQFWRSLKKFLFYLLFPGKVLCLQMFCDDTENCLQTVCCHSLLWLSRVSEPAVWDYYHNKMIGMLKTWTGDESGNVGWVSWRITSVNLHALGKS